MQGLGLSNRRIALREKNPKKKRNHQSKEREYNVQSDLVLNTCMGSLLEVFVDCGENVKMIKKKNLLSFAQAKLALMTGGLLGYPEDWMVSFPA